MTALDTKAIRARAEERTCSPRHAMASAADVPALCERVAALEAALRATVAFIEDDTCRHDVEKAGVLSIARAALEGR